ncbi:RHOMBOID-like protein 1 [Asparagus officinalis]|uniref:RHOMBOID-like protein 1 n=1 Tax=Asparagus officinalis TaxID=4686 RepID=UPI00098E0650|nr:RHOMBOID-like protein 1 [Asparagus officinalis]
MITMYINNCPRNYGSCFAPFLGRFAFQPRSQNMMLGPSPHTLEKMGALDVTEVVHGHQGWRLITCNWLHAGLIHILANMLSLLFIGIRLEQEFGFAKIGLLYAISGFGGSLMSALFLKPNDISVGASGALFGLLGSMLSELLTNWSIYVYKFAALFILIFIIVINLALGLFPQVDNFAHIGGFISGFLLGFIFLVRPQFGWIKQQKILRYSTTPIKQKHTVYQHIYWILASALLIAWFTGGLVLLYHGVNVNNHCSWCRYLSCIPTSKRSCR